MIVDITTNAEHGLTLMRALDDRGLRVWLRRATGLYGCHRYTVEIIDPEDRTVAELHEIVRSAGGEMHAAHTAGCRQEGQDDA